MSTAVTISKQGIDFGEIPSGSRGIDTEIIDPAPADALVTATIIEGSPFFKVNSITLFDRVMEDVDPIELPPHFKPSPGRRWPKAPVLYPAGQSDGSTAVAIKKGQRVVVEVAASAPIVPPETDTIFGRLLIQGGTWEPIGVPLSMTIAQTITTLSAPSLTIPQGHEGDLLITIQRLVGPDTNAHYVLHFGPESTGVSMREENVHLTRGETKNATLHFSVAPDAKLGNRDLFIYGGGGQQELALNIIHPQFLVSLAQSSDIRARRGISIDIAIDIDLNGTSDSTLMWFTPGTLPSGFSMSPHGLRITGANTVHLTLTVAKDAPETSSSPLTINWTADGNEQTGTLTGTLTLRNEQMIYDTGTAHADTVHGWAQLAIQDDGNWSFRGHVHENGVIGHDYAFAIGLNQLDDSGHVMAFIEEGKLGGTVAIGGPSRDDDWDRNGHDSRIAENWDGIKQKGVTGQFHVATDPFQAFEFAISALLAVRYVVLGVVAAAVGIRQFASNPNTICTWGGGLTPGDQAEAKEGVGVEGKVKWEQ
jgi:hypothetical protein